MSDKKTAGVPFKTPDNKEFEESLRDYKPEAGLNPQAQKKKKRKKILNAVLISFIGVCAAVLVVCIVLIAGNISDKERGKEIYDDAAKLFEEALFNDPNAGNTDGDEAPRSLYDRIKDLYADDAGEDEDKKQEIGFDMNDVRGSLSNLKAINDDVVGYIYVENTTIRYPLMRSSNGDDDYYLDHAFTGEYLSVGSIYMVSSCDPKLDNNYNTLIYGHNVVNGQMFHDVMKFLDPDFFATYKIYIYTFDGMYVYQPFSIYQTQSDYNYIQTDFVSENEFLGFASQMKANSEIPSDLTIGEGDTMITLSTCTGTGVVSSARYSLHAKLIDIIRD